MHVELVPFSLRERAVLLRDIAAFWQHHAAANAAEAANVPAVFVLVKLFQPAQIEAESFQHRTCHLAACGVGFQIEQGGADAHIADRRGSAGKEWQEQHILVCRDICTFFTHQ